MNVQNTKNEIYFNFSYFALRLLGKGLYSNAWTAIAELVANGFDAKANNVKIYINAANKEKSVIEIFDDGYGMGYDDLASKYTLIGKDKRDDDTLDEETKKQLMGRKGIGKLAALYLSKKYYLISKTEKESSAWCLDALNVKDSDMPKLDRIDANKIKIESDLYWKENETGTMIKLTDVDLRNFGVQSLKGLKARLADFFLDDYLEDKMQVAFLTYQGEPIKFENVKKEIAFKNMYAFFDNTASNFRDKIQKNLIFRSDVDVVKNKLRDVIVFDENKFPNTAGEQCFFLADGTKTKEEIQYKVEGWIGIHSTIDKQTANENDSHYLRNKVYNPNKLRLYVRKKLAVENFLDYLHNTQAFSNYIEGEISFDVLDDDRLPDIATSNRQGFDEESDRVQLLIEILKPIVGSLIRERVKIGEEIKNEEKAYYDELRRKEEERAELEHKAHEKEAKAREQAEQARDEAYKQKKEQEERADAAEADLHSEKKRNTFLLENLSIDKIELAEKFHLLKIDLDAIKKKIAWLVLRKQKGKLTPDVLWDSIKFISLSVERMNAVLAYALKAKFNTEDETISDDLSSFIFDYCMNVLKPIHKTIDISVIDKTNQFFVIEFSPQDIGAILENVVSNSEKFNANSIVIILSNDENQYKIDIVDDGEGLDRKIIRNTDELFEFGKGFTDAGSGVGLYHIKDIVNNKLNGSVSINKERTDGFELNIRIKNEL